VLVLKAQQALQEHRVQLAQQVLKAFKVFRAFRVKLD
jgi:hypothetical protein